MCTTLARGANSSRSPVTRSSNRAPIATIRSASSIAQLATGRPCMPSMPEPLRVARREGAERHQRRRDRRAGQPRERGQLGGRLGVDDAAAGVQHRPPRRGQRQRGEPDLLAVRLRPRPVAGQLRLVDVGPRRRRWPRRPGRRRAPGPGRPARARCSGVGDRLGDVVGPLDRDRVLDDRRRDPDHVRLLEGVRPAQRGPHLAGDEQRRDRVHLRVADRGDEVGRARPAGGEGDADPAGRARVSLGGVAGAGLVAHQHVPDAGVQQRVVERQVGAAGHAEDGVDPGALQRGDQGVGAAHRSLLWRAVRRT